MKVVFTAIAALLAIGSTSFAESQEISCHSLAGAKSLISLSAKNNNNDDGGSAFLVIKNLRGKIDIDQESNDLGVDITMVPSKSFFDTSIWLTADSGNDIQGHIVPKLETVRLASGSNDASGSVKFIGKFNGSIVRKKSSRSVGAQLVECSAKWSE